MTPLWSRRSAALALAALCLLASNGFAQQYPDKPIRLILPFPAGGTVDLVARLVTAKMADDLGRSFIIDNRSGAGGVIAADAVAMAAPDGYTILLTTPNHTIGAALNPKLPYDTEKDFAAVSIVAAVPELLVSYPGAPFTDFRCFVDYAKKNPGKLNYSSAGIGTLPHVTMELLLRGMDIQIVHIPYRGAAPAMTDLLSGVVQLKIDTYATGNPQVVAGKLRALAYAARARSPQMPDVPTVAEMGLPGYEGILWIGMVAPAGTPKPVVDRLAGAVARAVAAPDLRARFSTDGIDPVGNTPQEFSALIARELVQWRDLVNASNIKPE